MIWSASFDAISEARNVAGQQLLDDEVMARNLRYFSRGRYYSIISRDARHHRAVPIGLTMLPIGAPTIQNNEIFV